MGQRAIAAVTILAGALLVITGCDASPGQPGVPTTTEDAAAADANLWDPCSIDEDLLRQVGVDPATRDDTISGVRDVGGWRLCSWKDKPVRGSYSLGVWSTVHTIEESKQDANNIEFTDIAVAGRSGTQFKRADDPEGDVCYLSFPADGQSIEISVYKAYSTMELEDEREPCVIGLAAAESLVPEFPK